MTHPDGTPAAPRAAVLHPGRMGAAVAAAAVKAGTPVSWCPAGRGAATADRAAAAGLRAVEDLPELLATVDVVLAVCPPAAAEALAEQVAATGFTGLYAELNAVSSTRLRRIADRLDRGGARVVDGSIIGPPPQDGRTARLYLAGAAADTAVVAGLFAPEPVQVVVLPGELGSASALKMAFAGFQKATRSLAAVAQALAARHEVTDELLAEARRMAGAPLAELDYVTGVAARGWRWAPEMHEVADELVAADLPPQLALAAAEVLERWTPDRDRWDLTVEQALARLAEPPRRDAPPG